MLNWSDNKKSSNIMGMIYYGKRKSHFLGVSGQNFHFFKLGLISLTSLFFISLVLITYLFWKQEKQSTQIKFLKTALLKYQVKHDKIFEQAYNTNKITKSTAKEIATKTPQNEQNTIYANFKKKFIELNKNKKDKIKIQNSIYGFKNNEIFLSYTITNASKSYQEEGYLWNLILMKNKLTLKTKIIHFPKHLNVDKNSLEPTNIKAAYHYKIKNYLTKEYTQTINAASEWEIEKILIIAKDTANKAITGLLFEQYPNSTIYNTSS